MSSTPSTTQEKTNTFFKSGLGGRVFPCLNRNSNQTSSVFSSSVVNKHSKTTQNATISNSAEGTSDPVTDCGSRKKKLFHNQKKTTAPNVSVEHLNNLLDKHMIHSPLVNTIPDDDQDDSSDEYEEVTLSSQPFPLTPATKRAYKGTSSTISVSSKKSKSLTKSKDHRNNEDDGEDNIENYLSFETNVINKLNQTEADGQYARKMFEQVLSYHERQEQTQKLILENQKKIKKALIKNKIYVDIEETVAPVDESRSNNNEMVFPSELLYSTDNGNTFFDALIIPGERTKKNLFALKLVDQVFSREELLELDPIKNKQKLLEHPGYSFIREAVRCKFKLSRKQLEIEWPNIRESILNKRRNWKKDSSSTTDSTTISTEGSNQE